MLTMQRNASLSASLTTTVINALLHRRLDPDVLVEVTTKTPRNYCSCVTAGANVCARLV